MKQILLFFVVISLLTTGGTAFGQDEATPAVRHNLRLGSGFLGTPSFWGGKENNPIPLTQRNFYLGKETFSPSAFLTYTYQFKKWIAFGASFTYSGSYRNDRNLYNDALKSTNREHYVTITPTIRFDWLRGGLVNLYSLVGVGAGVNLSKQTIVHSGERYGSCNALITIDAVPIGITVGRKLFGFCELGIGVNGFARAGIGYKFNGKNSR